MSILSYRNTTALFIISVCEGSDIFINLVKDKVSTGGQANLKTQYKHNKEQDKNTKLKRQDENNNYKDIN